MLQFIPKKILIGFVILFVLIAAFLVIPTPSGDTVKAPFGEWRVELIGLGCCGQKLEFQPSSITGQLLEFTKDGTEVEQVEINIYATPTGSGFDSVEFDLSDDHWDYNCPFISPSLQVGNTVYNYDTIDYNGDLNRQIPLGEEVLFHSGTIHLDDIFTLHPEINENTDQTMYLDITFNLYECIYRGVSQQGDGPWQTSDVSFTVRSDVALDWTSEGPSCGDGTCEGQPYPGENCKTCPSDCGTCNAKITNHIVELHDNGLTKDPDGIQFKHGYDDYSWSNWAYKNPPYSIEVFKNADAWTQWIWVNSGYSGTLYATATVYNDVGVAFPLYETDFSDNGVSATGGDWYCLSWWTEWETDHTLTENCPDFSLRIDVYLSGGGSGFPQITSPGPVDGATVNTGLVPLEAYINDPDGEQVDCTFYYYDGTSNTPIGTDSVSGSGYVYNNYFVSNPLSDGTYQWSITATDADGDITFSDIFEFTVSTGTGEMVSKGLFSITDESVFEPYQYDGKTLG